MCLTVYSKIHFRNLSGPWQSVPYYCNSYPRTGPCQWNRSRARGQWRHLTMRACRCLQQPSVAAPSCPASTACCLTFPRRSTTASRRRRLQPGTTRMPTCRTFPTPCTRMGCRYVLHELNVSLYVSKQKNAQMYTNYWLIDCWMPDRAISISRSWYKTFDTCYIK